MLSAGFHIDESGGWYRVYISGNGKPEMPVFKTRDKIIAEAVMVSMSNAFRYIGGMSGIKERN